MDGTQSPGINYNSIDGLTTVAATSISINGSTINVGDYVTYTNATGTVNLNAKTLTNIANASALTDAVNLQTMNAKTYVGVAGSYRIESLSGGPQNNYFTLKSDYGSGILCCQENYFSKYLYGQQIQLYTSAYVLCGSIVPGSAGILGINATNLNLTGAIGVTGIITSNGSQIKNIANGSAAQDAVTLSQLQSISSLITGIPSTIVNGTTNILCNGTNIIFNTLGNETHNVGTNTSYFYETVGSRFTYSDGTYVRQFKTGFNGSDLEYSITSGSGPVGFHSFLNKMKIKPLTDTINTFQVNNAADASIFSVDTVTSAISCNTVVNVNSHKIINVTSGSAPGDAVNYGQLSAILSLPAGSIQGSYIVYNGSGYINNATSVVNLGAGTGTTGISNTNIGYASGAGAGSYCTNIGTGTGSSGQANDCVNVGLSAGNLNQRVEAIAIGSLAGNNTQGIHAIAVGSHSGQISQGNNAIAIGYYAGQTSQHQSSIIINATGSLFNSIADNSLYVTPIRQDITSFTNIQSLKYNTGTKEITYGDGANPYWSIFSNISDGSNNYCFIYEVSFPTQGYWGDILPMCYKANVNTNFGTAVWENIINPTTRAIIITIPVDGIYQINIGCGGNGPIARFIVGLTITRPSFYSKYTELIDFWTQQTNYYEQSSWAGTYFFYSGMTLALKGGAGYASFSGHLVSRL